MEVWERGWTLFGPSQGEASAFQISREILELSGAGRMVRKSYPVERNEGRWVWVDPPPVPHSAFAFPGWMHSGYPIMCHLESVSELIDEMGMRSLGLWGPVHELGHNQQRKEWELPPHTTEATCNLWSVYVHETVLGIPRAQAHPALSPPERENRIKTHRKSTILQQQQQQKRVSSKTIAKQ